MSSRIYFFLFVLLLACNPPPKASLKDLPNILFLFADDYTYDAIHALGNDFIETPN